MIERLLKAIENDPEGQIRALMADIGDNPLIIDKAQRSKTMALAIKKIVDEYRRKGQFILTGSSNVFTISEVTERSPNNILDWAISKPPDMSALGAADKLSRADYIHLIL